MYREGRYFDSNYVCLFMKRVLFSREGVNQFIKENAMVEMLYKRINLIENNINRSVSIKIARGVISSYYKKDLTHIYKEITNIPTKLYSMKELILELGYSYDVEVRRVIETIGVNKIKLANLVRFDIEDFNLCDDEIAVPYHMWKSDRKNVLKQIEKLLKNRYI